MLIINFLILFALPFLVSAVTVSINVTSAYNGQNIILYNVQYENGNLETNSYAKTSAHFYDEINLTINERRQNVWFKYRPTQYCQMSCTSTFEMTQPQKKYTGYTAWDRGHLTPAAPYLFSKDAMQNTHLCVNVSPQEPYSNQCIWGPIEKRTVKYFENTKIPALIITGISNNWIGGPNGETAAEYLAPRQFWKLLCYIENGTTMVVGFRIENSLIQGKNALTRKDRRTEARRPRSQREIMAIIDHASLENAWNCAQAVVRKSVWGESPSPQDCSEALDLPNEVRTEWKKHMDAKSENNDETFDNEECTEPEP